VSLGFLVHGSSDAGVSSQHDSRNIFCPFLCVSPPLCDSVPCFARALRPPPYRHIAKSSWFLKVGLLFQFFGPLDGHFNLRPTVLSLAFSAQENTSHVYITPFFPNSRA